MLACTCDFGFILNVISRHFSSLFAMKRLPCGVFISLFNDKCTEKIKMVVFVKNEIR